MSIKELEIETFNAQTLTQILTVWKQGQSVSNDKAKKESLSLPAFANSEWEHNLYAQIKDFTASFLAQLRLLNAVTLPTQPTSSSSISSPSIPSAENWKAELKGDFSKNSTKELKALSAFYYRTFLQSRPKTKDMGDIINLSERQFNRWVNQGLEDLVTELYRSHKQITKPQHSSQTPQFLSSSNYTTLVGVELYLNRLTTWLSAADGPLIVSIEGLGGIGKTSLAKATASIMLRNKRLIDICWVTANHEYLDNAGRLQPIADAVHSLDDIISQLLQKLDKAQWLALTLEDRLSKLKTLFDSEPYLVIIDNLETLGDVQSLLPALQMLAGTTRFLLTSRQTLRDYPFVQVLALPELSFENSHLLVNNELKRIGQNMTISNSQMQMLYDTIGGLALALKLTVGQLHSLPLNEILNDLRKTRTDTQEQLYKYIYYRSWQLISDEARQLLVSMQMIPSEGEDLEWLQTMSNLSSVAFKKALAQLRNFSLVEKAGSVEQPLYFLHRLTSTFLQNDLMLDWS